MRWGRRSPPSTRPEPSPGPTTSTTNEAWLRTDTEVAAVLATDVERGLTDAEAAARLARDGPNQLAAAAGVPRWRKLLAQFADPLIYLLLGAVVVSFVAWIIEGARRCRSRSS